MMSERQRLIQFVLGWTSKQLETKTDLELRGLVTGLGLSEQAKVNSQVVIPDPPDERVDPDD